MNKIKEFLQIGAGKKSMACICTDCTDSSLGNSERKSVYAGHDVDSSLNLVLGAKVSAGLYFAIINSDIICD